jgi:hypothetical protein
MNFRLVTGALAVAVCAASAVSASPAASYYEGQSLVAIWQVLPVPGMSAQHSESMELVLFGIALSAFAFRLRRRQSELAQSAITTRQ